jgi:hypothetical protein
MAATQIEANRASRALFNQITGKAGVYFIAPISHWDKIQYDPDDKMKVKIGLAGNSKNGNLAGRFNQYLLCWPDGFYVFAIIQTSTKPAARATERAIHEYLNGKQKYIVTGHSHDEEWFSISKKEIDNIVDMLHHNKNTKYPKDAGNAGKRVFPYKQILNLDPFLMKGQISPKLVANVTIGQSKIGAMKKTLIRTLDRNVKQKGAHTVQTSVLKPKKSTKANPAGRGPEVTVSKMEAF